MAQSSSKIGQSSCIFVLLFSWSIRGLKPHWNILHMENSCGGTRERPWTRSIRERARKVALFFVLAVAGREIVLHARIASKRRRLHRGIKKEAKRRKKKENSDGAVKEGRGDGSEPGGARSVEGWYGRRRGTSGGQGELPKTN